MNNKTCLSCEDRNYIYIENPEEMLNPLSINSSFLPILLTHMITFLVGVIGNSIVLATWAGMRSATSSTCTFLVSLAISDLLLLVIYVPLETTEYFVITWDASGDICKLSSYVEMLSGMASVLNLIAVSFERFVVIIFPMKARRICTISKCRKGLVFVWLLALLLSVPVLVTKKIYPITYYNNQTSITAYYCFDADDSVAFCVAIYQLISMFALPALFMSMFYFWVIRELWSSTKTVIAVTRSPNSETQQCPPCCPQEARFNSVRIQRSISITACNLHRQGTEVKKARRQVIKMLIFVILLFMVCWGPRLIMNVVIKNGLQNFNHSAYSARVICYLLSFIHSALNPFVYGFMSSNFRKILVQSCPSDCFLVVVCGYCFIQKTRRSETVEFTSYSTSIRRSRTRTSLELVSRGTRIVLEDGSSV